MVKPSWSSSSKDKLYTLTNGTVATASFNPRVIDDMEDKSSEDRFDLAPVLKVSLKFVLVPTVTTFSDCSRTRFAENV